MSEKKDGWYHSRDKRAKYVHLFRGGKTLCGIGARQDIRTEIPLPETSEYKPCPNCLWWFNNLFQQKREKVKV